MNALRADQLKTFLKGMAMGAADVVPGVSGGTIAFITGIYSRLIASLRSFNVELVRLVLRLDIKQALRHVDAPFLVPLGCGIALSFLSLAKLVQYLLHHHGVHTWAFFFGLIIASIVVVGGRVGRWRPSTWLGLAAGTAGAYLLVGMLPATTPDALWFVFLSGVVAICAMILPGLSGSYILLILGKYQYLIDAVFARHVPVVLTFGAGCAAGLIAFSHVLHWLLHRYAQVTTAVLTGLMVGSLRKVWPWKETLRTFVDRHGDIVPLQQLNVLPAAGTELLLAVMAAALGAAAVLLLARSARAPRYNG